MSNGFLVPINGITYFLKITERNDNYYLTILNKNNKIYVNNQELSHNFKNSLIDLKVRLKLIKFPIMMKPLMVFLFDHERYLINKRIDRIYKDIYRDTPFNH